MKIGVIAGSFRQGSYSVMLAKAIMKELKAECEVQFVEIKDLPHFNQDFESGETPQAVLDFRTVIQGCDGFVFVTPEYNRSYPGVLKNALDTASRPSGQNLWAHKPAAVVGVSPGRLAALAAVLAFRQPLSFLNVRLYSESELCLGGFANAVDENGEIKDETVKGLIVDFAADFIAFSKKL